MTAQHNMVLSTTSTLDGLTVERYLGLVSGEAILGVNMFRDMAAAWRNMTGGRSAAYEEELRKAKEIAMREMIAQAQQMGANGVIGIDLDYASLGADGGGMLMVTVSGTAVKVGA